MVGLEYLRVFFMISVVSFHAGLTSEWAAIVQGDAKVRANLFDVISYNLQSVAVPCFFIISNFLFCLKPISHGRLISRLIRLVSLYLFWVSLMVYHYRPEIHFTLTGLAAFLVSGGHTFYYFLAVLILLSPVTFFLQKLRGKALLFSGILSALTLFGTMVWLQQDYYFATHMNHCIVTSYAMVPLCSVLLARYCEKIQSSERIARHWGLGLIGIGIVTAAIEWKFSAPGELLDSYRMWLPKHARFSLYFLASALVVFAIRINNKPGKILSYLSKNSLGIYCLHGFCVGEIVAFSKNILSSSIPIAGTAFGCILTVVSCSMVSEFLRRALQRRLV